MSEVHYEDLKSPGELAKMYQDAIVAFDGQAIQSYTLPTGVSVTRADLDKLRDRYQFWRKLAHRADFGLTTIAVQSGPL